MEPRSDHIFEFGDFRLVPNEGLLLRNNEPVPLSIKAFATLVFLVERHGHLVQKSELLDEVWDGTFVEEAAVSRCVWNVRNALGDTSKERFILTIPRRGYRFVAPVSIVTGDSAAFRSSGLGTAGEIPAEASSSVEKLATNGSGGEISATAVAAEGQEVAEREPPQQVRSSYLPRGVRRWAAYAAVATLLLVGVALYFGLAGRGTLGKGGVTRIAVLPLAAVDDQNRNPVYDLGVPEALILKLGADKNLTVRQLNAVRRYADVNEDPIEVGKEQGVDYVLSGNYQIANGKIRVTAQLFDVATGKVEGTFTSDDDSADNFAAQDVIANNIGNKLLARFGSAATVFRSKRGTSNEEAYQLLQLAMALVAKGGPVNIESAIEYLDKAVQLDPNYARAWAGKAYAHTRNVWDPRGVPNREQIPKLLDAVQKALSIDPDLSEAHTVLCENRLFFEYDADGAERACRRAVELDPNSSVAHLASSRLLNSRGRFDEAFAEIKTAMDLDPASFVIRRQYANVFYLSRRYPEAEEEFKRAISLNPEGNGPYDRLILTLEAQGKQSEAFDCLIRWYEIRKEAPETIEALKTSYAALGWQGAVTELVRAIEARQSPNHYALAGWYAALGNKEKAFENLEMAFQERNTNMMFLQVDNFHFDSIRTDPRFADLVGHIEGKRR